MAEMALVYRTIEAIGDACATVIAVHGGGSDSGQLLPILAPANEFSNVIAPLAWRPLRPRVPHEIGDATFEWYINRFEASPEPATFGDSLWQLEQFVYDVRERQDKRLPIFLVGYGQGAVLAATLAMLIPEVLAGIAVLNGHLPKIDGWCPPIAGLSDLPFLIVRDTVGSPTIDSAWHNLIASLELRNGSLDVLEVTQILGDPMATSAYISQWMSGVLRLTSKISANEAGYAGDPSTSPILEMSKCVF